MFFATRHEATRHRKLSAIPDSASATGQVLGKETGHSGLLRDGDESLKSPERGEEYDCLPRSVLVQQLKPRSHPSAALRAVGLSDGTDTRETCKYTVFLL